MQQLDGTVITTALPQMARSFHDTPVNVSIGITAYLLTVAVFIPSSSWVSDRFGARTIFATAIVVFTLGSVLCGSAQTLWEFAGARIVQAVGGAMMVPVGRALVLRTAQKHELIHLMQVITVPGLIAPVVGPPLGGFITTYASWRWIFFLNVPIGLAGLVMVMLLMQNFREPDRRPFDVVGFVLSGLGLATLMYGLTLLGRTSGAWLSGFGIMAAGAVVLAFAVHHAQRHPFPLIDLSPTRIPTFRTAMLSGGALFRLTIGATPFLWPLMFQVGFGMTAFLSGGLMMACTGADIGAQLFARRIIRHFSFRRVMVLCGALATLFMFACALFTRNTPLVVIIVVLAMIGMFRSIEYTAISALAYCDVPQEQMSMASTLVSTSNQMSNGAGVAVAAIALNAISTVRGNAGHVLDAADFQLAFVAVAVLGVIATATFAALPPDAGASIARPAPRTADAL
jgi:EmrB/QacA subfamily drug resistance transporter